MSEDFISDDALVEKAFFGRSFRHSRGTDISVFNVGFSMVGHEKPDYYIEYVEPRKEYRIHIMRGEIIRAQKKFFGEELFQKLTEGASDEEREKFRQFSQFVRNNETGWRMYDIQDAEKVPVDVLNVAKKCMLVLGLDFGAVDIVFTKSDSRSRAFPLEVNTAPGLRDDNLELYATHLNSIAQ
jgi:D-alanine-D-alanine ligase-like ATP-grasp enzyme